MQILQKVAAKYGAFRPKSSSEFFALRLAQKLGAPAATASHFLPLALDCAPERLASAYKRASSRSLEGADLAGRFELELKQAGTRAQVLPTITLCAMKVERRSVAAAVFVGDRLDYTEVRQLAAAEGKALDSAAAFVNWLLASFSITSAAIESGPATTGVRRGVLTRATTQLLRTYPVSLWQVEKNELLAAFGYPQLSSRHALREVITGIWPVLSAANGKSQILDAVALGLWVQTERLFL